MSVMAGALRNDLADVAETNGATVQLPGVAPVASRLSLRLPEAVYRLQFNQAFTFRDARQIVPYLAALGVSDCYASPYIKARAGSMHGYDIVDHNTLNPEVGTLEEFTEYARDLQFHGMQQVLDVVPNHMGVGGDDNAWWVDVLENGPGSQYASYFDIDWMPLKPDLANKVLLPILEDQYGKVLEDCKLALWFEDGAFFVRYHDRRFPIAPHSWPLILKHRSEELKGRLGAAHPHMQEYESILYSLSHFPSRTETDPERVSERRREREVIRRRLTELCQASPEVRDFLDETLCDFNGTRGDPASFDLLDQLLLDQSYRLAYWQVAADEINYRRFFDVNELAAICMERPEVFQATHGLIERFLADGLVSGLRIDHPDGLYDPAEYLRQLQALRQAQLLPAGSRIDMLPADAPDRESTHEPANGEQTAAKLPLYLVVEKILEPGERLPEEWPVHGTTGYDFLNSANGLFVDHARAKEFDRIYSKFIHQQINFKELSYRCKKLIMQASMSSEISVLGYQLDRISEQNRRSRDFTHISLTIVIREIIACFPIYRTYVNGAGVIERDRRYIEVAVARARRKNPALSASLFAFVQEILLLTFPENSDEAARNAQLRFVGKFQQTTGPVMAKAVEDTAFYIYNRLVSLNEVGGDPERFGTTPAAFHQQNLDRRAHWPHALLASSTHDTKRSEDVRARINVLSEIPAKWKMHLSRWARCNKRHKHEVDGEPAPSRNDEYLLYQTLLGTWPFEPMNDSERQRYRERIQQYALKAAHEAKVNTSWISPNEPYEQATRDFIAQLLEPSLRNPFLVDFIPFARRIAELGIWNSLSQTVLKLTCPGVPDVFQGTELFEFNLVDPDNRQPVDFTRRREVLGLLQEQIDAPGKTLNDLAIDLVARRNDGRIKLYTILRLLNYRREHPDLFTTGHYVPLEASGSRRENLCAFQRQSSTSTVVIVVPRLVAGLTAEKFGPPLGPDIWGDTRLILPKGIDDCRFANILTGDVVETTAGPDSRELSLASVLRSFPVAVLEQIAGPTGTG